MCVDTARTLPEATIGSFLRQIVVKQPVSSTDGFGLRATYLFGAGLNANAAIVPPLDGVTQHFAAQRSGAWNIDTASVFCYCDIRRRADGRVERVRKGKATAGCRLCVFLYCCI